MENPLHKLKEIKPLIYLNRDEAILRLFEQIYLILKEELSKYTNNKFLFIPVSGKHLYDPDGTKEHFFLAGAPIGIFNFENEDKKIDAIASILSYTLYSRKHGLSATNLLSELTINESKKNIVSFAKISFVEGNKLEIEKNNTTYPHGEINLNFLNKEEWQKIKSKIKNLIVLENDCYAKVPNLDTLLVDVPLTPLKTDKSNSFEYIISNLYHFGNSSELKSNYYFPSFHFIEKENQPNSSYGFFVVSTNDEITGKDETDNPIEFLERVALVVFSLVGIIEQHHYVKIEQHRPLINDIDLYPKTLLTLAEKINEKQVDKNILMDKGASQIINSIIHLEEYAKIQSSESPTISTKMTDLKTLLFGEDCLGIFDSEHNNLRKELIRFYKVIEDTPQGFSSRLGHVEQNINAGDASNKWTVYENSLQGFICIKILDEVIFTTYFKSILDELSKRDCKKLSKAIENWEKHFSKVIVDGSKKFKSLENKKIFFEESDWKTIRGLIDQNYTNHTTNDKTVKNNLDFSIDTDTAEKISFLFKMQDEPMNIDTQAELKASVNVSSIEKNKLPWLKHLICKKYSGVLEFINVNDKKEAIRFQNTAESPDWKEDNSISYAKGFYYKLTFN